MFEKYEQKVFFFYLHKYFLLKHFKHLVDIIGHGLLDIYFMHLFTSNFNFKLFSALLATEIYFLLFRNKYKKLY